MTAYFFETNKGDSRS